jgi:hypothetical protein
MYVNRWEFLVVDEVSGGAVGDLSHHDPVHWRCVLETRCGVDGITGDNAPADLTTRPQGDQSFACVERSSDREIERALVVEL